MGEALDDYYRDIGKFGGNPKPMKRKKADGREKRIKAHTEDEIKEQRPCLRVARWGLGVVSQLLAK